MKKLGPIISLCLTMIMLLTWLPHASAAADTSAGASQSWFKDQKTLSVSSTGYEQVLYIYFKYREADFLGGNSTTGSAVLKSTTVMSNEKERTAAVASLRERGGLTILGATVSAAVESCKEQEGLLCVTVYEWTFYDYDDPSDGAVRSDVSGFGTRHQITLEAVGLSYRILSDDYDESDIDGFTTFVSGSQAPLFTLPSDGGALTGTCYPGYDPALAVQYANAHVSPKADLTVSGTFSDYYSDEYYNFNAIGGDCANYVSQCLYAGGLPQTVGESGGQDGWYFGTEDDRSGTWTRSTLLRRFLGNNYGVTVDNPKNADILVGSPVFYSRSNGYTWDHTTICVGVNSAGTPIVNSHNNDRYHVVWNYWSSSTTMSTVQLTAKETPPPWSTDKMTLSAYSAPTALVTGSGYPVYGTITSEHSLIKSVAVGVYDLGGRLVVGSGFEPGARTAVVDTVDDDIRFGTLSPGWYHYRITAINQAGTATLLDKLFLVNDGSGSKADPYLMGTPEELQGLAESASAGRSYSGAYFRLSADVHLSGTAWKPIGTAQTPFAGSFDGYAHAVSGLQQAGTQALFGWTKDGEISNLAADGVITEQNGGKLVNCLDSAGSPAGVNNGQIVNCWYPGAGATALEVLNSFVKETDKNGAGRYFLWKSGGSQPQFAPLTVTYFGPGSQVPLATVGGLPYGSSLTVPQLQLPDGKAVSSWYQDEYRSKAWDWTTAVTTNLSLYASLKTEHYTIVLDTEGAPSVSSPGEKNYGDIVLLPTPKRDGYTFAGWYTQETAGEAVTWTSVPDLGSDGHSVTLYARWTAHTCTLSFTAPGATNVYAGSATVEYGAEDMGTFILPTKPDAGFAGYFTADGTQITDCWGGLIPDVKGFTEDGGSWALDRSSLQLLAKWNTAVVTVAYRTNYGSLTGATEVTTNRLYTQNYAIGTAITLPVPVRSGYTFFGWHEKSDFSGPVVRSFTPSANTRLYARWVPNNMTWKDTFVDAQSSDWYYSAVKYASQNGILNGVSATEFAPAVQMTRAMLVAALWRMEGEPEAQGSCVYADVPAGRWDTQAILWATDKKIVSGIGNGQFNPSGVLTRQEGVTILYRYAQYVGKNVTTSTADKLGAFQDRKLIPSYAEAPFSWAVAVGLMTGTSDTTLAPGQAMSRAMAAALLMRFERLV